MNLASFPWLEADIIRHSLRLMKSYQQWTGEQLVDAPSPAQIAHDLFHAPFVLLSHGIQADPVLNYGNQPALDLWEITWPELICMPSRLTAEPVERQGRAQLLNQAAQQHYIQNYQGIRISTTGRRFRISNAEIWDVWDEKGQKCGQGARFSQWQWL